MKINPISANIFNYKAPNKTGIYYKNNTDCDVFIKNKNISKISFASSKNNDIYGKIKNEMTQYIKNSSNISTDGIEKIISKYIEGISVKDLDKINYQSTNATNATAGYFENQLSLAINPLTSQLTVEENGKNLYLRMKDLKKGKVAKSLFLARAMHEISHIIQENSSNKNSKINLTKNLIYSMTPESAIDTIQTETSAFKNIEYLLLSILAKSVPNMTNIPAPVENASRSTLNTYIKKSTGLNVENIIQSCLSEIVRNLSFKYPNADKKSVYQYISICAYNEKEAYQNELDILKEEFNIKGSTTHDIKIEMYNLLGEYTEKLASKL